MKYSEQLNGYWEEGYHYYIEIRDDKMTVRNYMRKIDLKTKIAYDADLLESGKRTVISVENNVLSRDAKGDPFTMIRELAYEDGELKLLYYYTIMGETLYTLKKVDHDPFDHIMVRDEEYLDSLQGEWIEWRANGTGTVLTVSGDRLTWHGAKDYPFHVISYKYSPDKVMLVPADLTENSFPGFCSIEVLPDMLTTYIQVFDMSVPMTVFARAEMIDQIDIPDAAKAAPRSTMTPSMPAGMINNWMKEVWKMETPNVETASAAPSGQKNKKPAFCVECGFKLDKENAKFCPNCGYQIVR